MVLVFIRQGLEEGLNTLQHARHLPAAKNYPRESQQDNI